MADKSERESGYYASSFLDDFYFIHYIQFSDLSCFMLPSLLKFILKSPLPEGANESERENERKNVLFANE